MSPSRPQQWTTSSAVHQARSLMLREARAKAPSSRSDSAPGLRMPSLNLRFMSAKACASQRSALSVSAELPGPTCCVTGRIPTIALQPQLLTSDSSSLMLVDSDESQTKSLALTSSPHNPRFPFRPKGGACASSYLGRAGGVQRKKDLAST